MKPFKFLLFKILILLTAVTIGLPCGILGATKRSSESCMQLRSGRVIMQPTKRCRQEDVKEVSVFSPSTNLFLCKISFDVLLKILSEFISGNELLFTCKCISREWKTFIIQNNTQIPKSLSVRRYLDLTGAVRRNCVAVSLNLKGLKTLKLEDNCLCAWVNDEMLNAFRGSENLTHLDISGCFWITDAGLQLLSLLTKLEYLDLHDCNDITDAGLRLLPALTKLEYLDLGGIKIIDDARLAKLLQCLPNLTRLNLSDCRELTGAFEKIFKTKEEIDQLREDVKALISL